jgi:hypothetical protein
LPLRPPAPALDNFATLTHWSGNACKNHFCWYCLAKFDKSTGHTDFYKCVAIQSTRDADAKAKAAQLKNMLHEWKPAVAEARAGYAQCKQLLALIPEGKGIRPSKYRGILQEIAVQPPHYCLLNMPKLRHVALRRRTYNSWSGPA